jgi:hypothetical protein
MKSKFQNKMISQTMEYSVITSLQNLNLQEFNNREENQD